MEYVIAIWGKDETHPIAAAIRDNWHDAKECELRLYNEAITEGYSVHWTSVDRVKR